MPLALGSCAETLSASIFVLTLILVFVLILILVFVLISILVFVLMFILAFVLILILVFVFPNVWRDWRVELVIYGANKAGHALRTELCAQL